MPAQGLRLFATRLRDALPETRLLVLAMCLGREKPVDGRGDGVAGDGWVLGWGGVVGRGWEVKEGFGQWRTPRFS